MARQRAIRSLQSAAGAALLGLGLFMLYGTIGGAVACIAHVVANHSPALGTLPALIFSVSQVLDSHAAKGQSLSAVLIHGLLISSSQVLLVVAGTMLSRKTHMAAEKKPGRLSI